MKKLLSIILSIIICAVSVQGVFAESSDVDINTERNVYDDCADFSKVVAYSEGLSLDVVTDENKYAFSGDVYTYHKGDFRCRMAGIRGGTQWLFCF